MGLEAYITLGFLIKKRAVVFCLVTKLCLTLLQPDGLSMGLPRQEYWSGLPFPSPGDLTDPGIEPGSPALEANLSPRSTIQHCIANLGDSKEEGMR